MTTGLHVFKPKHDLKKRWPTFGMSTCPSSGIRIVGDIMRFDEYNYDFYREKKLADFFGRRHSGGDGKRYGTLRFIFEFIIDRFVCIEGRLTQLERSMRRMEQDGE